MGYSMIAGVDGCSSGWMVALDRGNAQITTSVVPSLRDLLSAQDLELVVIDIPIGLLDRGARAADREARRFLGNRASCVFNAPIRPILGAASYLEANAIGRTIEGKGCSKQSFALMPKIIEVDDLVRAGDHSSRVLEGHPEISFGMMNDGVALSASKHTAEGQTARAELLARHLSCDASAIASQWSKRYTTDVFDALAMLWTARRVVAGESTRFRAEMEIDSVGIDARITA